MLAPVGPDRRRQIQDTKDQQTKEQEMCDLSRINAVKDRMFSRRGFLIGSGRPARILAMV
ncbi:hypothetical protein NBRC116599_13560 [Aquicoccus sp. SU-CL01552]